MAHPRGRMEEKHGRARKGVDTATDRKEGGDGRHADGERHVCPRQEGDDVACGASRAASHEDEPDGGAVGKGRGKRT